MDNLEPVNPDELPDGYSAADPNATGGGPQKSSEAQQKELQKQAVLEQALTPDALARLRRIKVRCLFEGPHVDRQVRLCPHNKHDLDILPPPHSFLFRN
jgi:hypothetical protein